MPARQPADGAAYRCCNLAIPMLLLCCMMRVLQRAVSSGIEPIVI